MGGINFEEQVREHWRQLRFFYRLNSGLNRWEFFGSKEGLNSFSTKLREHANDAKKSAISEDTHLGPYQYLKIVTWTTPQIRRDGFYGSTNDLRLLADLFEEKLKSGMINNEFQIDREYSTQNECDLFVKIMETSFDPASLDVSNSSPGNPAPGACQ